MTPYSSQLGGKPYWVTGKEYPTCDGKPLILLAQINFDELEQSMEGYPDRGMLQFFISDDDVYGCDFEETVTQKYRVIYHEKIDYNKKHLQDIPINNIENSPIIKPSRIKLKVVKENGISSSDFQFITVSFPEGLLQGPYEFLGKFPPVGFCCLQFVGYRPVVLRV